MSNTPTSNTTTTTTTSSSLHAHITPEMIEKLNIPLDEWTEELVTGSGVFDTLMRANLNHLEQEFQKNRIKGGEYSSVYLGTLQYVLQFTLTFVLERRKIALDALLKEKQIEQAMIANETARLALSKIPAEIELILAQVAHTKQQTKNAITENATMLRQQCKLAAEYDLLLAQITQAGAQTKLINQKLMSEKAQVSGMGVDDDSVIGRQKNLYKAQTDGYQRNAEQEAAKILINSWLTRRTTDEATSANSTNKLDDISIGNSVEKLLSGIGI